MYRHVAESVPSHKGIQYPIQYAISLDSLPLYSND